MGDLGGGDWQEAAAEEAAPAPVGGVADHLVVMVHGIVGSAADWKFGAEQFDKLLQDKVIVHCSNRNMHKLTLDGIDVMGERLAQEQGRLSKKSTKDHRSKRYLLLRIPLEDWLQDMLLEDYIDHLD